MELALEILGWSVFALVIVIALLLDLLGLFGNWIILAAVGAAAAISGFDHFGGYTLAYLFVFAGVGELLEALAAGLGAAKYGGGKGAIAAALVGTLVGAILGTPVFPILGTIAGACAGAFVFATLYEYLVSKRGLETATKIGFGAALGKICGLFAKTFVGFAMLLVAFLNF